MKKIISLCGFSVIFIMTFFCFSGCAIAGLFDTPDNTYIYVPDNTDKDYYPDTPKNPDNTPDKPDIPDNPTIPDTPATPDPVYYNVVFKNGDEIIKSYKIEQGSTVTLPSVPDKQGYTFTDWMCGGEPYDSSAPVTGDLIIIAGFKPEIYKISYIADGVCVAEREYTVEDEGVDEPSVPEKEHYTAAWENYSYNYEDTTVNAIYVPINYTITYVVDGSVFDSVEYNFDNLPTSQPELPQKSGYTVEWESFTFGVNVTVNAVYNEIAGTDGLIYELRDGSYTVTGYEGTDTEVIIPVNYCGVPVTSIGSQAFFNCSEVKSVQMFGTVTQICALAFAGCGIKEMEIPYGVEIIGNRAFAQCVNLVEITVSDSVCLIDEGAFFGCTSLDSVKIGANVSKIGVNAFYSCNAEEIEFADTENWTCVADDGAEAVPSATLKSPANAAAYIAERTTCTFIKTN